MHAIGGVPHLVRVTHDRPSGHAHFPHSRCNQSHVLKMPLTTLNSTRTTAEEPRVFQAATTGLTWGRDGSPSTTHVFHSTPRAILSFVFWVFDPSPIDGTPKSRARIRQCAHGGGRYVRADGHHCYPCTNQHGLGWQVRPACLLATCAALHANAAIRTGGLIQADAFGSDLIDITRCDEIFALQSPCMQN